MKKYRFISQIYLFALITSVFVLASCISNKTRTDDFNNIPDRTWIGENYWAIPMEDWHVRNGRVECIGQRDYMRVNALTKVIDNKGDLTISANMGFLEMMDVPGAAGFEIGLQDHTDNDYRSVCHYGKGIRTGITTDGYLFIGDKSVELGPSFDLRSFFMTIKAKTVEAQVELSIHVIDQQNHSGEVNTRVDSLKGMIAVVNNFRNDASKSLPSRIWFDNLTIEGSMIAEKPEQSFGPILWTMYTLSKQTMKLTAQFPPIGEKDTRSAELQIMENEKWSTVAEAGIDPMAYTATFKVTNWDDTQDHNFRVVYQGINAKDYYEGTIKKDPVDKPLKIGGLTCQEHGGYPYRPLVENLAAEDVDLLYFSGDQLYEGNGGYGIIRFPEDRASLNYLGKWYLFGWAFGEVMKDRPTICIPDDHEVFQGNLWGAGGEKVTEEEWNENRDCTSGFVQPVDMVNVVMTTNCAHLPDPFDPTSMKNGIQVYYTDLLCGRVSFAIAGDRIFKSGPEEVAFWEGRKDHLKAGIDPSQLSKPGLKLLGDRQLAFLEHWVEDWNGSDMKCLLTQTIFGNIATHHGGEKMYLAGDLDSGGWPKEPRDKAIKTIRKAFAYHICGDQHLPMLVQYGVNECRDAGWVYCTPAISVGYERRSLPDMLGLSVKDRPEHNLPNTGCYTDAFGNKNYVYAVGNPESETRDPNRYMRAQKRASGYGIIEFNQQTRDITANAIRFLADLEKGNSEENNFPGWPLTVNQLDNYGREAKAWLPTLTIRGNQEDPVVMIYDEKEELVYALRINGSDFTPKVFREGSYEIRIGYPETDEWKILKDVESIEVKGGESTIVSF